MTIGINSCIMAFTTPISTTSTINTFLWSCFLGFSVRHSNNLWWKKRILRNLSTTTSSSITSSLTIPQSTTTICQSSYIDRWIQQPHVKHWLVVGDGDFSYSASLSQGTTSTTTQPINPTVSSSCLHTQQLIDEDVHLIASVLEDEVTHTTTYRNSQRNTELIRSTPCHTKKNTVLFSIDATKLEQHFPLNFFDRIIFNFPHWRGKANNRYNRILINDFLRSASCVLKQSQDSEIHIALCEKQGGADATTLLEWRSSWLVNAYAADHGLVMHRLEPFPVLGYNLSSHRGVDRSFPVGTQPLKYVFGWPFQCNTIESDSSANNIITDIDYDADPRLRIAFRHELRLILDPQKLSKYQYTLHVLEHSNIIPEIVRQITPQGIYGEAPYRTVITNKKTDYPLLIFLVVYYSGRRRPLTRNLAESIRCKLEETIITQTGLDVAKRHIMVSKPFPYPILDTLLEDR